MKEIVIDNDFRNEAARLWFIYKDEVFAMMENGKSLKCVFYSFGIGTLLMLLAHYENVENYEMCQKCIDAIDEVNTLLGYKYLPKQTINT